MSYNKRNANGQAVMANSAPVVIASNQSGVRIASDYAEQSGLIATGAGQDLVPSTDMNGVRSFSLQLTGTWVATLTLQGSNDNSTWQAAPGSFINSLSNTLTTTFTGNGIIVGPVLYRFMRVRATAFTSGSVSAVIETFSIPFMPHSLGVSAAVTGSVGANSATGSAVPANAFYLAGNGSGNLTGVALGADNADGVATTSTANRMYSVARNTNYNGTTHDLQRSANAAHATSGTGLLGAAALGFDGTNYRRMLTETTGQQVVEHALRTNKVQQATTITSSTSETTVLTAVASTFLDVYGCIVANTSATACEVVFKDATAGTSRFSVYVPAGDTRGFMLPASDGHNQSTVNNNWTATCSASVVSIKITMLAVKNT